VINVRTGELQSSTADNHFDSDEVDKLKLIRLTTIWCMLKTKQNRI